MTLIEMIGLVACGMLLGGWIERSFSFVAFRRELTQLIDGIKKDAPKP